MPGAPPPSEPRTSPEAWDCLLSVHSIIHQSHARKFGWAGGKEKAAGVCSAAKRRLWLAGVRAAVALAARARMCWAAMPCSRSASRTCRCAVACASLQHVVPPMVQCCAMWCKCGLCGAGRARTMGEP